MSEDHAARGLTSSRAVGFAGSALVAVGGLGAGALPVGTASWTGGQHARLGLVSVYTGLALLLLAWWWYGRATRGANADESCRTAWRTLALWAAPMLLAPPLFSRDVYSYLAQGLMIDSGLNVYQHGPSVLGGLFAAQVPSIWQHTPSPYGPTFLFFAEVVAGPLRSHLLLGVIAMRLVAVAGLALLAGSVPILARSTGVRPSAATWLAVLNPLVLIHLVGDAHNDALMVGLLAAGLAAAIRHRPITGSLLIAAAALVKWPAALGLIAVAAIWAQQMEGRWRWTRAGTAVLATAGAATVLITTAAGTGYGWVSALDTPISTQSFSLTNALGRWTADLVAHDPVGVALAEGVWRWAGVLATLAVAVLVWSYRDRLGPVYGLGIVLVALALFGPAIRPWYVVWGLVPLAAVAEHRKVRRLLAVLCAGLVLVVFPDGVTADPHRLLLAVLGSLIGIALFLVVRLAVDPVSWRPARAVR